MQASLRRRERSLSLLTLLLVGWSISCSALADSHLAGGIGASCLVDADCHAAVCDRNDGSAGGICVRACTSDLECPRPSKCVVAGGQGSGLCQKPLAVEALYIGVGTADEGWSLTHQEGLNYAQTQLGYLSGATMPSAGVTWGFSNFVFDTDIAQKTEEAVARGAQVIIANSFSQRDAVLKVAPQYIDRGVNFLTCAGFELQPNVGSYFGYMEQAWYVAGRITAIRAQKSPPRLGVIVSFITPEVIRHINAFTLGAQSYNPQTLVEVRFMGFWFDYNDTPAFGYQGTFMQARENLFGEELLAAKLIESGCEIIAHQADSQRPNKAVDRWIGKGWLPATGSTIYTIANDNRDGCYSYSGGKRGAAYRNCLGSVYWNWGPLYQRLFDQMHRGTFMTSNVIDAMSENPSLSIVGFEATPGMGVDESALASTLQNIAKSGPEAVFRGPYDTTGQHASVPMGQTIRFDPNDTAREWRSMCWFVKGVIEKVDPNDPASADRDALVPDGSFTPTVGATGQVLFGPPGAPAGAGLNCKQNY